MVEVLATTDTVESVLVDVIRVVKRSLILLGLEQRLFTDAKGDTTLVT